MRRMRWFGGQGGLGTGDVPSEYIVRDGCDAILVSKS